MVQFKSFQGFELCRSSEFCLLFCVRKGPIEIPRDSRSKGLRDGSMGRDLEKGSLDTSDAVPSGDLNVPKQPVSEQHLASWFLVLLNTFYELARETWRQMISLNYLKFRFEHHCRPYFCICPWQSVLTPFPLPAKNVLPCSVYLVDLNCLVISLWNEKLAT